MKKNNKMRPRETKHKLLIYICWISGRFTSECRERERAMFCQKTPSVMMVVWSEKWQQNGHCFFTMRISLLRNDQIVPPPHHQFHTVSFLVRSIIVKFVRYNINHTYSMNLQSSEFREAIFFTSFIYLIYNVVAYLYTSNSITYNYYNSIILT